MQLSLTKIRSCRLLPVVLAITWLPYVATRCMQGPATHAGCHIFPGAVHAEDGHAATHSHAGSSPVKHARGPHHRHAPVHTCCDLTGKCNVRVVSHSQAPPLDAPASVVALSPAVTVALPALSSLAVCDISRVAHSPPTYLCNATLLL
jgi:hypothetical protein